MTVKKLLLIDAMAMAFRSHHAMGGRPLLTSTGLPTSAIYGSLTILMKLMDEERPDYVVVACDSREATFRHEMYEAYKANRTEFPEELSLQMPYFFRMFEVLGIPVIRIAGYEADDIIGSLVTQLASPELHCYIISGDKDFMQLVNENVWLYSPQKGGVMKRVDIAGVRERFGCAPSQVIDMLALIGDSSDNVPGVHGIGDKGAAKLIEEFHSLENLYEHIEEVRNQRHKDALVRDRAKAFLSKELVTIKKDIAFDVALRDMGIDWEQSLSAEPVLQFLEELEFRILIKRIRERSSPKKEPKKASKAQFQPKNLPEVLETYGKDKLARHYHFVNTKESFTRLVSALQSTSSFVFDVETTGLDCIDARIIGISFAVSAGKAYYVPLLPKNLDGLSADEVLQELHPIFADGSKQKIAHNLKFDLQMLHNSGVEVCGPFGDTMLASFLLDSTAQHGIDAVSQRVLDLQKIPTTELMGPKYQIPMSDVDIGLLSYYACEDSDCCWRLNENLVPRLHEEDLQKLYEDIEVPLVRILADMEQAGIYVNVSTLQAISQGLAERLLELEKTVFELAGEEFNLNSPKQMQVIIFEKLKIHEELGIKKLKKTKSGFSTDVSVLEDMSAHPMIAAILEYRTLTKLKGTYTDTLPLMINKTTQRIHTSFHQTGTATGRLSSSDPNLQNIPIRSEVGRKIRSAFEGQGDRVLVSADYSQIELRLLAHISQDKNLIQAFVDGKDIHTATAATVFGKDLDSVSKDERSQAKAINYGVAYGMGPQRFAMTTGVSFQEARDFIAKYFEAFPRIRVSMDNAIDYATAHGYSKTLLGRKRRIDGLDQKPGLMLSNARNIAVNAPIQGTAADLIKLAMIRIDKAIREKGLAAKMLLQIHDELVFECSLQEVDTLIPLIREAMEGAMQLSVPLVADIGYGKNWLEAHN